MLQFEPGQPPVVGERYKIIGVIDESGSTKQYLAWDTEDGRWCTVRMLGFRSVRKPLARTRFEREVKNLMKVKHPNVLPVYAADASHPNHPWAATAVAEAGSVADWMSANGPLPSFLAIDVMSNVCGALAAAHQAGVSHGSIGAQHVLIDASGRCLVSGLRAGVSAGELQTDLRAVGALLYAMLTGENFDDKNAAGVLSRIPHPIARAIERTRRRGGSPDVKNFSRDLEAAVLELPMPDGDVPPLASPDAALPLDPDDVWNPATEFPDLVHLMRLTVDHDYQAEDYLDEPTPVSPLSVGGGTARPGGTAGSAGAQTDVGAPSAKPIPYQMSRGTKGEDFDAEVYRKGDKPLYEEPPPKGHAADEWDSSLTDLPVKEEAPVEEKPFLDDSMLLKILVVCVLLFAGLVVGAVVSGTSRVAETRVACEESASSLVAHVRTESALVYDLASVGGDRQKLEAAYFAFTEAKNEIQRAQRAAAFAALVDQQSKFLGLDTAGGGGVSNDLAGRLDKLALYNQDFLGKRADWARTSGGLPGALPVLLGLQVAPPY